MGLRDGHQLARLDGALGVEDLNVARFKAQSALDCLHSPLTILAALEVEGEGEVLQHGGASAPGALVELSEAEVDLEQTGREQRGALVIADGFLDIALGEVDFRHADVLGGGFLQAAEPLEHVGAALQRDGVIRGDAMPLHQHFESVVVALGLHQRQTEILVGIRLFRAFLQGAGIGVHRLIPFLIPCKAMT